MDVVCGAGTCSGVASQMCVSAAAKTACTDGSCGSDGQYGRGISGGTSYYFYGYKTSATSIDTMAADVGYCDAADNHYFQTLAAAGYGVAGAQGSYSNC